MKGSYQTLLEEIRRDNVSGASVIASKAAECLSAFVDEISGLDMNTARRRLAELGDQILAAQPRMAPLWNLINEAYLISESRSDPEIFVEELRTLADGYVARCDVAEKRLIAQAMELLEFTETAVTYSSSRTVFRVLREAHTRGALRRVYLTESRPILEGRPLALSLLQEGIECVFGVDVMLGRFVNQAEVAVVGADAITAESLCNKIGTRALALLCREAGIRLYAVADRTKLLPPGVSLAPEPAHDASEVWEGCPDGIQVENVYFEETPLSEFAAVITEEGTYEPAQIRQRVARIPISNRLHPMGSGSL